jgi:hypothetical protein
VYELQRFVVGNATSNSPSVTLKNSFLLPVETPVPEEVLYDVTPSIKRTLLQEKKLDA